MKVKEMLEFLQKCNPEADIILVEDDTGNGLFTEIEVFAEGNTLQEALDKMWNGDMVDRTMFPDNLKVPRSYPKPVVVIM